MQQGGFDIMSQLSGLRLSDGVSAGEHVRKTLTPPAAQPLGPFSTSPIPSTGPSTGVAPTSRFTSATPQASGAVSVDDVNRLFSGALTTGGGGGGKGKASGLPGLTIAGSSSSADRPAASSTTDRGSRRGGKESKESEKPSQPSGSSSPKANSSSNGISVPKPRSETSKTTVPAPASSSSEAAGSVNPKVLELLAGAVKQHQQQQQQRSAGTSSSGRPTPLPAPETEASVLAKLANAQAAAAVRASATASAPTGRKTPAPNATLTTTTTTTAAAASPTSSTGQPSPTEGSAKPSAATEIKVTVGSPAAASPVTNAPSSAPATSKAKTAAPNSNSSAESAAIREAIAASKFVFDALGGPIDNLDALKPIIRTLPSVEKGGRYIIVGDVHGCVEQLEALVAKVNYVKNKDCLIIVGDYVNKGPDSIGVIRACQRWGALGVLGNHDYTLLNCCARQRRRPYALDDLKDPVKRLAQNLPKDCEYYLRSLPHILRLPAYNVVIVHAGLNIQYPLEKQNVVELMHLRRLERVVTHDPQHHNREVVKFNAITKGSGGEPWGALWEGPETVIFGHDAYAGFQAHQHALGIDTGCVYGDPLTCVVYSPEHPQGEFFSVPGLPKFSNEMIGLPPPKSEIYEQLQVDLEKQIIRPTTRSTPPIVSPSMMSGSPSGRPVFLATPLSLNTVPRAMTATLTTTNARLTPSSLFPTGKAPTPSAATPAINRVIHEAANVSTREVQKATLLALSAARELRAIATILAMPLYDSEVEAMLSSENSDTTAQEAFWTPFTKNVLDAVLASSPTSASPSSSSSSAPAGAPHEDYLEEVLTFALEVCDCMEGVKAELRPQLEGVKSGAGGHQWSRSALKYVEMLLH